MGGMTGAEMIAAERATHAARGWTVEHDLRHPPGDLARAAVAFSRAAPDLLPPGWRDAPGACIPDQDLSPAGRARRLVIAGALIAAELDCMRARGEAELEPTAAQSAAFLATAECPFDCSVCRAGEDE